MKGKVSIVVLLAVAFITGILFTTAGANLFDLADRIGTDSRADDTRLTTEYEAVAQLENAFTEVAEAVSPTVVQIRSEQEVERSPRGNPFEGTPFEDFFGRSPMMPDPGPRQGLGSGVVVRSDGYIVTNNHVVEGADRLTVAMFDGTEYDAEVVGADPMSDLAVVKIDAEELTSISYGNAETVQTGQWVLAFGSPLSADLENTVTAGIVSAKGRVSESTSRLNIYAEFIQTDAAINPGNSGGPLVNLRGELVGINTAILSRTQQYAGIGFAIPVDLVQNVTAQLIEDGTVERGYLGVGFAQVPETLSEALGVPRGAAQITQVQPGTPADEGGLETGQVIVAINEQQLTNYNQLRTTIGSMAPGDEVAMTVVNSDGERRTVEVTLGEQPDDLFPGQADEEGEDDEDGASESISALGLDVRNVTPEVLQRLGLENEERYQGVLITDVDRGSAAYRDADLRRGDIIVEVAEERVRSQDEFTEAYGSVEAGEAFIVRVLRRQADDVVSFVTALRKPA